MKRIMENMDFKMQSLHTSNKAKNAFNTIFRPFWFRKKIWITIRALLMMVVFCNWNKYLNKIFHCPDLDMFPWHIILKFVKKMAKMLHSPSATTGSSPFCWKFLISASLKGFNFCRFCNRTSQSSFLSIL